MQDMLFLQASSPEPVHTARAMGNRLAAHIRAGEWKVTDLRQGYRFLFGPVQLPVPRTDPVPVMPEVSAMLQKGAIEMVEDNLLGFHMEKSSRGWQPAINFLAPSGFLQQIPSWWRCRSWCCLLQLFTKVLLQVSAWAYLRGIQLRC